MALIVKTIISLKHSLGLATVAEGVEKVSQLARMRDLGCNQVQGYLLGRPLQMDGSTELITLRARTLVAGCKTVPGPEIVAGPELLSETSLFRWFWKGKSESRQRRFGLANAGLYLARRNVMVPCNPCADADRS